jgi:hypothetical protein
MKKVAFLMGAGFNVPPNYGDISTQEITNLVCASNPLNGAYEIAGLSPGLHLFNILYNYYDLKMVGTPSIGDVNFETIIYLVEELYAFYSDRMQHNPPGNVTGVSGAFSTIIGAVENDIHISAARNSMDERTFLKHVYATLLQPIIEKVGSLDSNPNMQGMIDFKTKMLDGVFAAWIKRTYTLNYDTWITQNAGYFDGFENGDFDSQRVYTDREVNCHYNLHGSVRWQPHINDYRIEKKNGVVNVNSYIMSDIVLINKQPLIPTPIITGYNKSSRLDLKPYIALHYSFLRDIIESDFLVVIGYGGGDPHINEILNTYKGKVLVINYFSNWLNPKNSVFDPFDEAIKGALDNIYPMSRIGWADELNWDTNLFVKCKDNRISVWWKGLNDDLYNEIPNLIK